MRTYEFIRYDSKGKKTETETREFGSITEAESYGYGKQYHEVVIKTKAN